MTIDEQIAILQAAKAGKAIEFRFANDDRFTWSEFAVSHDHKFNFNAYQYRIKREPREWVLVISGFSTQAFEVREGEDAKLPVGVVPNIRVREVMDGEQ